MNAVFATDADLLVDDYRAFFILGDRFHRANRRARGELAVHTTVACPERRESLEHRRLHSYPVCAGERIEAGAVVIVPVLTCLDTVTAADAFGRIEEDASRLAIAEPRGRNQAAVLSGKALSRRFQSIAHAPMYHFFFAAVNYWRACEVTEGALENVEYGTRVEQKCVAIEKREAKEYVRFDLPGHVLRALSTSRIGRRESKRELSRQRFVGLREISAGLTCRRDILSAGSLQYVFSAAGPFRIVTMNRD